jgi:hypothetical protein
MKMVSAMTVADLLWVFHLLVLTSGRSTNHLSSSCHWSASGTVSSSSSYWSDLLASGRFRPTLTAGGHHLTRLRHQLMELRVAVEFYKDLFSQAHTAKPYQESDAELEAIR